MTTILNNVTYTAEQIEAMSEEDYDNFVKLKQQVLEERRGEELGQLKQLQNKLTTEKQGPFTDENERKLAMKRFGR